MTEKLLAAIGAAYPLTEGDAGEYRKMKVSGMNFHIRPFRAEGLGHVSVMTASGFFGLMKMDTLIINPTEVDMPLLSYDRVYAMGNDTLIFELYDTFLSPADLSATAAAKEEGADLPDHDLGSHWYDSIKLPISLSKKGKKKDTPGFDALTERYMAAFLADCGSGTPCDGSAKREKASRYVEGLLKNGGPSTDVFRKGLGDEKTAHLFRQILFGTKA